VQEHEQVRGAPVDHAIRLGAVVAAKLAELVGTQQVEAVDLVVEHRLLVRIAQRLDKRIDRLGTVRGVKEDRPHFRHSTSL
jgi:hypothetical protein